jgi:Tautomerase enzyme
MPLVRIDLRRGRDGAYRQKVGRVVYEALLSVGVENDRFQIIGEHDAGNILFDPNYLGVHRSKDLVIIQITWNEGRTVEQKNALQVHRRWIVGNSRPSPRGCLHQLGRGQERKLVIRQRRGPVRVVSFERTRLRNLFAANSLSFNGRFRRTRRSRGRDRGPRAPD